MFTSVILDCFQHYWHRNRFKSNLSVLHAQFGLFQRHRFSMFSHYRINSPPRSTIQRRRFGTKLFGSNTWNKFDQKLVSVGGIIHTEFFGLSIFTFVRIVVMQSSRCVIASPVISRERPPQGNYICASRVHERSGW